MLEIFGRMQSKHDEFSKATSTATMDLLRVKPRIKALLFKSALADLVRVSREQQHVMLERPHTVEEKMLTQAGIEPATLSTLDWHSNQLSYCAVGRVWVINSYHYEDG